MLTIVAGLAEGELPATTQARSRRTARTTFQCAKRFAKHSGASDVDKSKGPRFLSFLVVSTIPA